MFLHGSGKNPEKDAILGDGAAHSAALEVDERELAEVIARWKSLPQTVRTGIVAMIRST